MNEEIERAPILDVLRKRGPRALHVAEICAFLGVPKWKRDSVLDVLEELASLRLVQQLPGNRFRLLHKSGTGVPPTKHRADPVLAVGRLTMHPSGFGFVSCEGGGADAFIPPPFIGGALQGDRVRLEVRASARGREGRIVEVLDRGLSRIAGTLRRAGGNQWVDPDDPRVRGPVPVSGASSDEHDSGALVVVQLLRYPRDADDVAEGTVVDVLGRAGLALTEVARLLLRDAVVEGFTPNVLAEASALPARVTPAEKRGREDLRDLPLVTIDPADARDHDDAVWGERTSDGGYRVVVAIADVSHYVREATALDAEAAARGCSIYLPDRAVPMLPPTLSSGIASLVPGKDRLALAVEIHVGPGGAVRGHRFLEGLMRSRARLTYEGVARALDLTEAVPRQKEAESHRDQLVVLRDLASILRAHRIRRGSLDFDLPEGKVVLDDSNAEPVDVVRSRKDPGVRLAYRIVEELMLLANEVVAGEFSSRSAPTIYRVHGKPDEKKILQFVDVASALGHHMDVESATNPKTLARFLRRIEGNAQAPLLSYLLLRAMQQAIYSTDNIGHFALAARDYLHFTSPIRRYPDLAVHRMLRAMIRGQRVDLETVPHWLRTAAFESSRLERRAALLERDVVDLYRAIIMRDRVGETFDATVSNIAAHGFYCTLDEPYADVLVPFRALHDRYETDALGVAVVGRATGRTFRMGDRVQVELADVSIERRELVALPVGEPLADTPPADEPRGVRGKQGGRKAGKGQKSERQGQPRRSRNKGRVRSGGGRKGRR